MRDKLAAEQSGKSVVASEKFESGASVAASLLTLFYDEQAEIRLVIDDDADEFGSGRSHLYELLKRLAFAEPSFTLDPTSSELEPNLERILNESDDSHCLLVTANEGISTSPELLQRLIIVKF